MIVSCPKCQAKYRLEEAQFAGRAELKLRCTKCDTTFVAHSSPPPAVPAAAKATMPTPAVKGAAPPPPRPPAPPPDSRAALAGATMVSKKGLGLQLPTDKRVALSVTGGPFKGKVFTFDKPRMVVGRAETDIVVDDPEVSRKHCAVEVYGANAMLVDLGSTNGTFVDDKKIETHKLEHLSEFRVGGTTLMFTMSKKE